MLKLLISTAVALALLGGEVAQGQAPSRFIGRVTGKAVSVKARATTPTLGVGAYECILTSFSIYHKL